MQKKIENFMLVDSVDDKYIIATYYLESKDISKDLYQLAKNISLDQSAGTWTDVEGETLEMLEKYGARVVDLNLLPSDSKNSAIAKIAYPIVNFPIEIPMILATVAGNLMSQDGVKLLDIQFTEKVLDKLVSPLVGVSGIRKKLNIEKEKPLIGAILKPCIGVEPEISAEGAAKAALGGVDVIKDDELLSGPSYSPMVKRVSTVMEHLKAVGKEKDVLYAVNITGRNLLERAYRAIEAGANALMVNHFTLGWGIIEELVIDLKDKGYEIPILGHIAGAGAIYKSKNSGIAAPLLCGKLSRLAGLDIAVIYPDQGRFKFSTNELIEIQKSLNKKLGSAKKCLPMLAGGLHPGKVPYMMDLLGNDILITAGGGIYGHPDGAEAGAKAMRQALNAHLNNIKITEAAKEYKELNKAISTWGVYNGN